MWRTAMSLARGRGPRRIKPARLTTARRNTAVTIPPSINSGTRNGPLVA